MLHEVCWAPAHLSVPREPWESSSSAVLPGLLFAKSHEVSLNTGSSLKFTKTLKGTSVHISGACPPHGCFRWGARAARSKPLPSPVSVAQSREHLPAERPEL